MSFLDSIPRINNIICPTSALLHFFLYKVKVEKEPFETIAHLKHVCCVPVNCHSLCTTLLDLRQSYAMMGMPEA